MGKRVYLSLNIDFRDDGFDTQNTRFPSFEANEAWVYFPEDGHDFMLFFEGMIRWCVANLRGKFSYASFRRATRLARFVFEFPDDAVEFREKWCNG